MPRPTLQRVLIVVAVMFGFACQRGQGSSAPEPSNLVAPKGVPQFVDGATGMPVVEAEFAIDFGRVRAGTAVSREVTVRNAGSAGFTITRVDSQASGRSFEYSRSALSVAPGAQGTILVAFRPSGAELADDSLQLTIENGEPSQLTVRLHGTGFTATSPELAFAPGQIDFGTVPPNTPRTMRLTISNVGANVADTDDDNLRFVARDQNGQWLDKSPRITGSDADAFTLEWPPAGYSAVGLREDQSVELRIGFVSSAVARKAAVLEVYSNDPTRPSIEVPITAIASYPPTCAFDVIPATLDFGTVEPNHYLTRIFTIRNLNPIVDCSISMLDLTPATYEERAFALVNGRIESTVIPGGAALRVPVRFQPKKAGSFTGTVEFQVADASPRAGKVTLEATSRAACLAVEPRELDFGTIGVGCGSRERLFTLRNTCADAFTVERIDIQEGQSPDEFLLTRRPSLPAIVDGGGAVELGVTYYPSEPGDDAVAISIQIGGSANPYIVPLAGRGALRPVQTDVFSQSDMPKDDFLFIVDNSISMADKQANLAANLGALVDYLVQQRIDWHVAVTTTDATSTGEAGRFLPLSNGNPRVVSSATANAAQVIKQNLNVGTAGSEVESLIRPAYLALTNPLISTHNADFYRDCARLNVVIISDAADQDPLNTPVSFYESFLTNLCGLKVRSYMSVSAVIPLQAQAPAGCSYDTANAGIDTRVAQLVQRTGGLIADICSANWSNALLPLVQHGFGLRTTFFLSRVPDLSSPDPIVISIDGQPYPQYDSMGGKRWDYNSANNAIEFAPAAVPDPGVTLTISYHVACAE